MDKNNKPNIEVEKLPDEDEQFGRVTNMLGANRVKVKCEDSEERTCRIPGRMQKSEWIREQDLVIVEPWSFQDEKGDVVHRYSESEEDEIMRENTIQLSGSEDN